MESGQDWQYRASFAECILLGDKAGGVTKTVLPYTFEAESVCMEQSEQGTRLERKEC